MVLKKWKTVTPTPGTCMFLVSVSLPTKMVLLSQLSKAGLRDLLLLQV